MRMCRELFRPLLVLIATVGSVACSAETEATAPPNPRTAGPLERCSVLDGSPVSAEAGFVDAEDGVRLFYSFRPADENPDAAPLLVFTNGAALVARAHR